MPNFNKASLSIEPINIAVNDAIERAVATVAELPRPYLGASIIGHECARRTQFDWWCKPTLAARTREIFDRGHYFEERAPRHLMACGRASDGGGVQVGTARGAAVQRRRWRAARSRRWDHHPRP